MTPRIALCVLALCFASTANAGAWLQPERQGLLVLQGTYFTNDEFYNRSGDKRPQPTYRKYEFQPYAEYGLTKRLTVGGTAYMQRARQSGIENDGIADPELFARMKLWQGETQLLSIQPLIKLPSQFDLETPPRGGSSSYDAELSLLYGKNLTLLSPRDYLDIRVGYRSRLNGLHDQIRADAALGMHVAPNLQLIPAVRSITSTRIDRRTTFSENGDQDFNLVKFELGASYAYDEERSLNVTAFDHVDGKQTGTGGGIIVGVAQRF